jgi:hypothetical protein
MLALAKLRCVNIRRLRCSLFPSLPLGLAGVSGLDSHFHPVMLGVIEGHRAVDPASMQKTVR